MHRNRLGAALLIVMFTAVTLVAQEKAKDKKNAGAVEQQITALEDQGRDAALKGDTGFLEQYLADDYVGISGSTGHVTDKSQSLNSWKSGDVKYTAIDLSDRKVRVLGDTAIVNGTANVKGTFKGQSFDGTYSFTRVWMKRGGKWQAENFQATPVK